MEHSTLHRLVTLAAGDLLRVEAALGQCVVVFDGKVWITQQGDLGDYMLGAGETFMFDRSGLALVEAFTPTRLAVLADGPAVLEAIGYEAAWPNTEDSALFAGSMARTASKDALSYA